MGVVAGMGKNEGARILTAFGTVVALPVLTDVKLGPKVIQSNGAAVRASQV